jgi:hypothetical protein
VREWTNTACAVPEPLFPQNGSGPAVLGPAGSADANRAVNRPFDEESAPRRNVAERNVNRLKQWFKVAIHVAKWAVNY